MSISQLVASATSSGVYLYTEGGQLKYKLSVASFPENLKQEILANKQEIIHFLTKNEINPKSTISALASHDGHFPLSFAQQRLWFIDRFEGQSAQYNIPKVIKVAGDFSVDIAERAIKKLIWRHKVLRTTYGEVEGEPFQQINQEFKFQINRIDLSALEAQYQQRKLAELIRYDAEKSFDLATELMLRVSYIIAGPDNQNTLLFNMHHIASDGWSMNIFVREFVAEYQALQMGQETRLTPLAIQYIDFAVWQRQWLTESRLAEQLRYWRQQLSGAPLLHRLPLDYPRPERKGNEGARVFSRYSTAAIEAFAMRHGMTPFMVFHAALSIVLCRHSNQSEFIVGTPFANRQNTALAPLIGFFVNTLILKSSIKHDTVAAFLTHIRDTNLAAQSYQDLPFEQIVEHCQVERSVQHTPIFQVMLSMFQGESSSKPSLSLQGVEFEEVLSDNITTKYDLDISISLSESGCKLTWVYDTELFNEETITQFDRHFGNVLDNLLTQPVELPLVELELLSERERSYLLTELNSTAQDVEVPSCLLHELFERQAKSQPDAVAVETANESISYGQLNQRANQLARQLQHQAVQLGDAVGILLTRSVNMVVAVLAVLKAGGRYVPLDPNYPKQRLEYIVADTQLQHVICNEHTQGLLDIAGVTLWQLDATKLQQDLAQQCRDNLGRHPQATSDQPSYLIYTSGSTGKPKGVVIAHRNALAMVQWAGEFYQPEELAGVLASTSLNFDLSVFELFVPLSFGGKVILVENILTLLNEDIAGISLINTVPSGIDALLAAQRLPSSVLSVNLAGEPLAQTVVEKLFSGRELRRVVNLYGPSEDTTYSTYYEMTAAPEQAPRIGRPVSNTQAYVLGEQGELLPFGVTGELYLGGAGVACGYLNQPQLTAQRFIPDRFSHNTDARLYRTGDLVRYDQQGELCFIGRVDEQVKLRGFRIELGEIEHHLNSHDAVIESLVLVVEEAGESQLQAYVRTEEATGLAQQLREYLRALLPEYMLPSRYIAVSQWPLSPNGKIDKSALKAKVNQPIAEQIMQPQSETEVKLLNIWSSILNTPVTEIDLNSSFFSQGGHSLRAVKMQAAIQAEFAKSLSLQTIFKAQSVRNIAHCLDEQADYILGATIQAKADKSQLHPLSYAQKRLWFIDNLNQGSSEYHITSAVQLSGKFDLASAQQSFTLLIERHETLRTVFIKSADGVVMQKVNHTKPFQIKHLSLTHLTGDAQKLALERLIHEQNSQPFDLSLDQMLRVSAVSLAEDELTIIFTVHHIASDAWSMGVLVNEFCSIYQAQVTQQPQDLPPLSIQYSDYAHWQQQSDTQARISSQLHYWQQQLQGLPSVHQIPLDHARPSAKLSNGKRLQRKLPSALVEKLQRLATAANITPFMLYHGALSLLISKYSYEHDVVIGTPVANRCQTELEPLIGFFVNTLVLRSDTQERTLSAFFQHIRDVNLAAQEHQEVPFEQVVDACCNSRTTQYTPLFQIMLNMNNTESSSFTLSGVEANLIPVAADRCKYDLEFAVQLSSSCPVLMLQYDTSLFLPSSMELMLADFAALLTSLSECTFETTMLSELTLSSSERGYIGREAPQELRLQESFQQQVNRKPKQAALQFSNSTMTYADLAAQVQDLACYLVTHFPPHARIGICLGRCESLLVSVLAILRADMTYVPMDPSHPEQRLLRIAEHAELAAIITKPEWQSKLQGVSIATVVDINTYEKTAKTKLAEVYSNPVAYVIYTSGSTGTPKGIEVLHKGLSNYLDYAAKHYLCAGILRSVVSSTLSFDATLTSLLAPLISAKTITILPEEDTLADLYQCLRRGPASLFKLTPSHLKALCAIHHGESITTPHTIVVGGEQFTGQLLGQCQRWLNGATFVNEYGPSETVVGCCDYVVLPGQKEPASAAVSIGRAIANTQLYVLDPYLQVAPKGGVGELCIAGFGVAKGYVQQPQLTAEKFLNWQGERIYRSGDLVRQRKDGNLVYVGRIDEQVKIRGYRIELAEIEALAVAFTGVEQAVAHVIEGKNNSAQLLLYITLKPTLCGNEQTSLLKRYLAEQLPEYMVPSQFVVLEQFPLTVNGKVDKRALPQPELTTAHYRGPQNKTEAQLQQLWSSLLKIPQASLSCEANFFALGGDSILSIQLVSRAAEQGLYFSVKDLFRHQHIVALARCVKQSKGYTIAQEAVIGEMPLLPIQQAFFKNETALAHFNQSVLLSTPEDFDTQCLIPMLQALVTRHDALRLSFDKSQGQWRGWYQALEALALSNCIEQHEWDGEAESLTAIAERAQRSLSPIDGELLRLVYLANKAGTGRLLLVIHHLVVDGVSWRILLSDIAQLYQQYQAGEALQLGDKTHSYQQWGRHLQRYSESEGLQQQRSYWRELEADNSWQQHYGHEQVQAGVRRQLQIQLSEDETQALLTMVPQSYRTQVNEVLLAALWLAHQRCSGAQTLSVTLEGHGREGVAGVIDLSQTVGWFTSMYPLQLSVQAAEDVGGILMAVKEQYRQVPDTGIGYGVLKYLCGDSELADKTMPALQFNYLGQFDQTVKQTGAFSIAEENRGQHISAARIAQEELVLNGKVVFGSLGFTLNYDTGCYCEGALSTLMKAYEQALRDVITHCKAVGVGPYTPSDFPLARVTTEELERWDIGSDIADLYPATGMQQGLLFHGLLEAGSYVTQTRISFKDLDASAFKAAWLAVIERHNIFRTAFVGIEQGNAHQRVSAHAVLPWKEEDLREMSQAQQQHYLDDYQRMDKRKAFAIDAAPLMRFSLFNVGDEHTLLWSYHHALLDGWCIPLVFKEIKQCYEALCAGIPLASGAPEYSYRDYAQWLSEQDKEETVAFWRDTLAPLSSHTQLPAEQGEVGAGEGEYRIEFSVSETAALQRLAAEARTTLNIVVQTAWGVLLQRYGNQGAVVFGSVTSGRPASLAGVESILGLFINTVPVVVESGAEETVLGLLQAQHEQQVAREGHSYCPLYEIQKQSPLGEPLFNSVFVFENYPVDAQLSEADEQSGLEVTTAETTEGTNYDLTVVAHVSEGLSIRLEGGAGHYNSASLARLGGHYKRLLLGLTKALKVAEVELLSERERSYLLTELNSTAQDVEVPSCLLHELFERQAKSQPDAVAVETASESISYGQLNQRANQLARQLQHQAVQLGDAVGILLTRSVNMVVAVLAVLKAGGRYVPLDPNYPKQRLEYIVADTQLQHVICNEHTQGLLDIAGVTLWQLDATKLQQDLAQQCRDNLGRHPQATSDQPSYLIYTSGSTGKPKGVVIAHRNALAMVQWAGEFYQPEELAGVLASTSLNFDLSVFELFVPLSFGGKVILVENILTLLNEDITGISLINTVPSGIDALLAAQRLPSSVLSVNLAGEPLAQTVVEKLFSGRELRRVVNLYGPSEDTTYSTYYEMTAAPEQAPRIGRPVSNTQAYVLGEQGELLPFGVTGELYLGGAGVACGYLNQPQLTAQRFIPDRFSHNTDARLYRTGDLVRYDQQGELCFIGRVDEQVKLRGFRIELGEIEHHLNSHDAVIESLVLVVEEAGESQLQAYVRTEEATGLAQQLREYLRALLPEYMLPSRYIAVSQWPLSPNGKIDKSALKQLHSNTELEAFIAPRNATEEQLLLIWQRLLKNDAIGINDHFFTVGGDSIIAIQLVAMAREVGLHITLKEVMQLPTVADQALVVKASKEVSAEQSPLSGEFRPLPIQLRFLQRSKGAAVHHYNQSILLQVPIELSQDFLRQAVSCLLDRHDALRLRFTHKSIGWMGEFIALEQIDINRVVQNVFVADWSAEAVTEIAAAAQSGFNISKGELFKAVLISGKSEARLLLVAHHLVVDGVSWRILVQDLQRLWCQHQRQEIPRLPAKTSSIRQWSDTLALHYDDFQAQQVFWLAQLAAENTMMPLSESEIEPCLRSESEIVKLQLTHSVTRQLLGSANQAYRTQVEDLLLSGLYLALQQTFAVSQVAVALESHGRDPISDDVDLSETVGWFTSLYPLLLSSEGTGLTEVIIAVKERRRVISESNVGFGTLKYYSQTSECSHFEQADPFVLFNYLGQIEINAEHEHGDFSLANESMGSNLHEQALREFAIAINGQVSEGLLHLMIDYSVAQFSPETMVALKNNLAMALQDIANHCEGRMPMLTTSDVPHVELQQSQLNEWQKRFGTLINIFPATPLQHGIFFQSQIDKKAYLTQVVNQISGELNIKAMELAWQYVTNRHEILRSGFAIEKSSLYRFVLAPDIKVPVRFLDWSDLSDEQRHSAFITLREQDREMAMPLNEAPLHRVTIVRYSSMQHQLLWTHHHLILDGWCLQTVYQELLQSYLSFANSQPLSLPKPIPLDGYYDWLQSKDKQSALDYWHTYLHDFDSPTALLESQNLDVQSGYVERQWQISTSLSQKLRVLASEAKVTLNAVIQWAWGYLLQRYSGDQKVLFGTVISGRPSEVQNIEKMVGLFINTIPVKVDFVPSTDLKAQLKQLHESQLQSQEHGFLTLPEIRQQTAIAAEVELFDSIVVFENYPTESNSSVANNTSDVVINSSETAEYSAVPLTFIVNDSEHLQLTLGYRKERFSDNTIAQMQHHLDAIFSQLADGQGVGEISLLSTSEQHLLAQQHDTFCSHNLALLPHQYVDHFAQVTPNSIAVLDTQETLTYQQLNQAANRLARLLQAQGVMQESFVALYLERHCSMVIAILAVLKAGGAYVPIDPSMPDARSSAILDQLGDVQVLTQQHLAEAECLQSHQVTVIDSEATLDTLFQYRATTPSTFELSSTNLAYMIFTSGTTGQPKGVMVEHQALLNRVLWMQKQYGLKASDKVLQKTPYGFDVSVWEFVWPWTVGASIVLAKPEGHKEPKYLAELIQRQGITHCHFVPSMLQAFMQHAELSQCQTLKQVFCSGEALTRDHREQFIRASSAQLHNLYGPTEAAIDVSYWDCSKTTSAPSVPIGYAIDNINCVVVSPDFAEQPIGIPGELLISGIGLARGYFQQEQLTAEKFITVSLANRSQQRYYRTGDLVRRLECGALEFLGRLDHQVKIRGLRVELGEIQAAIAGCDEVEEAFVSVQELQAGEQLIAFCVTSLDSAELSAVIPKLLASTLPNYMIPATYIALTELPVTVNGKLDRKALYSMVTAQPQIEYVPAHTATEVALEEVWRECLGITEPLSTVQSFFALGGNSLHAMSILDRVQSHWDYPFEIADLFAFQTIKELAQFIDATQSQYSSEQQELEADSEAFEEMEF